MFINGLPLATFELKNLVGWADRADTLRELLQGGKKIIVSTIHKFSFILDEIGSSLRTKNFAIVIDEAHSSQNGEMASSLATSISGNAQTLNEDGEPEDTEDKIHRIIKGRKLAKNANYYAFTATPKNKTLEMFGEEHATAEGLAYAPFHEYTMKQAIEEKFILDVVRNYTPYQSYYEVVKKVEDDPQFDKDKAPKRIRAYVERQTETIEAKSRIIVDHFCTKVFKKIGGRARAMVVTSSIERAIDFYQHISRLLEEQGGKFKARAVESKPRERIEQAGTASVASGAELLAVILKTGTAGCDVMELSRRLIDAFGGVETLVKTDLNTLKSGIAAHNLRCPERKILGLGRVKILELTAAFELARRGYAARQTHVSAVASSADAAGLFLTWGLYGAGKMMGIALVDHIIITEQSHYSFADNGRLCNKE